LENSLSKEKVVVIVGPTASGKTALSLHLADEFRGEIVSADSCQIYKGMDIGTAKASKEERKKIKHWLIDIKKPDQEYSVGQYKKDAVKAINQIIKSGRLPIVVGGTGLYISALVNNLDFPKVKEDKNLRKQLEKEIEEKGLRAVFDRLVELDPEAAYIIDPNNPRRVIRALEVAILTGKPFTEQRRMGKPLYDFLQLGITQPAEVLKDRINKRVDYMMKHGLIEETGKLVKKYGKVKALDSIDYREIIYYLDGKITREEAAELIKKNTWHYAKHQLTWFNKDKRINWVSDPKEAEKLLKQFLQ
jgi:tRNA dimethylallyltransferase